MENNLKLRRIAQQLRKNQTKEENHLWYDFLKTYPVQFRRQVPVGCNYVDFLNYQAQLIVELDGSQHYEPSALLYDKRRTTFLESNGYKVLRFSNLDIWHNFSGVCQTIDTAVRERLERQK